MCDVKWHKPVANSSSPFQSDGEEPTSPTPAEDPETVDVAADAPAAGGSSQMVSFSFPNHPLLLDTRNQLRPSFPSLPSLHPVTSQLPTSNPAPKETLQKLTPKPNPADHPRSPQRRPEARPHPRRPRPRPPRSLQSARPAPGAHVRAERRVRGGGLQEAGGGAVRGARDPADQGARRENVGGVGRLV